MIGDGDLELIFASGDFDTAAVFASAPSVTVRGWFTEGSEAAAFGGAEIETINPMFDCETSAVADISNKDSVLIGGTNYIVERIQKNGNGISTVHLKTKRA